MTTIKNPILTGFNPDPSICRAGEDYYIAVSTFEWFPGVGIYHSRDLKNWRLVSRPLNRISQLDMKGNPDSGGVWAPALSYADGKFWLIYTDVKVVDGAWKDCHNYLVTSKTIDGEWSDPIHLNSSGFDPSLFHDDDGRKYLVNMFWDNRIGKHDFYGIVMQEYSDAAQKLVGDAKIIFKGTDIKLTEAPHLYKINGYYYLLTAEGGTRYEHQATIARSKDLWGSYEVHPDNPLITSWPHPRNPLQKAGHASIVKTHTDEWFLVHLTGRPLPRGDQPLLDGVRGYCPLGRETAIQRLEWKKGWPYVVGGNLPSVEIEGPDMEEVKWDKGFAEKDDLDALVLNYHFQSLRIPLGEDILSLTDNPGHLRLYGHESLTSKFTQAYIARRWQHFNFTAETKVSFNPKSFQQAAGLVNYYNTQNWTALQMTWDEEKGRIIDLTVCDNATFDQPLQETISVPDDVAYVYLRVEVRTNTYRYLYSFDGNDWTEIPVTLYSYKLSDDYVEGGGFFTGAFVGMQCQDTSGRKLHADFDFFIYREDTE
ncbi:glycoside hydrolase family 43 protein [Lentibacillus salicampi]|uniref:Glycoside hydrolase family 43 protein n=1 Tax=Lentibacillus salicampi TaxID=175306 RepID=A0A4Y9AFC3_9BACI|nr:glycoside hydrolase family 43 protein [Lentibacillus salicampi]TFJ93091.1 glycoside hydrolase family 43 protein [Lentibacillus salicampi]